MKVSAYFIFFLLLFLIIPNIGCRRNGERISPADYKVSKFYFKQADKSIDKGELNLAIRQLKKGLRLNPYAKREYLKLAVLYKISGNKMLAVETFKEIIRRFPDSKEAKLARKQINKLIISVKQKIIFSKD